jgi:hypothetical protein
MRKASNWVDRGEPPEATLTRVLSSYLELEPSANEARLREYAGAVRGMALESTHLAAEHPARHRRAAAIALWHIVKAAEVRDRAIRLVAEHAATPDAAHVPLSTWLAERLLRDDPRARS